MRKTLIAGIALALSLFSGHAFAAGEIQLHKIQSTESQSQNSLHSARVEAIVADLDPAKQVSLRLKQKDGSWTEIPLRFNRPAAQGKELWSVDFGSTTPDSANAATPLEFSLKYTTGGQTYWDNNGGANYRIDKNSGTVLTTAVVYDGNYHATHDANANQNTYAGWVTVKNLAPVKDVRVLYSTDGWATTRTAVGVFNPNYWYLQSIAIPNPNAFGFEEWYYSLDVGTASQVEYVIRYTANGQTYWDNNFGRNYRVSLTR